MADFGRLILHNPEGIDQEFTLNKPLVTLGRATTNDIALVDGKVSRNHAQIKPTPAGITILDLNSSNGTFVNGQKVTEAHLKLGDTIQIGGFTVHFQPPAQETREEVTVINTELDLGKSLEQMTVPISLNDNSIPRMVIHAPDRTWEIIMSEDSQTLGRADTNDLFLDYPKISRQHARIERRGSEFFLCDQQSTNGTWMGQVKIDQHRLVNGETFRVGPVEIMFKSGFSEEEMTVAEGLEIRHSSRLVPVIFVPGTMGSELWLGSERVWPNVPYLFKHPEIFRYTENTRLKVGTILNDMVIVPNLISIEQYKRMGNYLVEELGYERGNNFIEFAYDWRQDVRQSARELARFVDKWQTNTPIIIIAHSLGTLVTRYYIEKLGGKKRVARQILMGGPHFGVPKIAANLLSGVDLLPFGLMGKKLTEVIETFPSVYQFLPTYPCAVDQDGTPIDFIHDESWVKEEYRHLLRSGREFRQELGQSFSIPTVSIFGYGLKTASRMQLLRNSGGLFQKVLIGSDMNGDSSVPEFSAILPGSEIHPVQQYHGSLFVDNDVKMRLKLELLHDPALAATWGRAG